MTFPDLDSLLPHRPPIRLVETIIGEVGGAFVCSGRIPTLLASGGRASPLWGLELGAQAAAVLGALERSVAESGPRVGYLVSIRQAEFAVASLPADRVLTARVRAAGRVAPLAKYDVSILEDGEVCLSATIGTYLAE